MSIKNQEVIHLLNSLRLSGVSEILDETIDSAIAEGLPYASFLRKLLEFEIQGRDARRKQRLLKTSCLVYDKTLDMLDLKELPEKVRHKIKSLCDGSFVDRCENVLVFGLPGRGKTHIVCAIGHELISLGFKVLFISTFKLVQRLLVAKKNTELEQELKKLDRFDVVILDDIGYTQQDHNEMDVLFTFLGERYERKPVMITSNLVFSQWDKIFKDTMTTSAAIDRVVHHSVILEINTKKSYRLKQAGKVAI